MANEQVVFVPFTDWRPDGSPVGEWLDVATNVLPINGSWHVIRRPEPAVEGIFQADKYVYGAHSHIFRNSGEGVAFLPGSDETNDGDWVDYRDNSTGELYKLLRQRTDWARAIVGSTGGVAKNVQFLVDIPTDDLADFDVNPLGHVIGVRYRAVNWGLVTTPSWQLKVYVEGTSYAKTLIATASGSADTSGWLTLGGSIDAFVAAVTGFPTFHLEATNSGTKNVSFVPTSDIAVGGFTPDIGPSLWQEIDESGAADDTHANSKALAAGEEDSFEVGLTEPSWAERPPPAIKDETWQIQARLTATRASVRCKLELLEGSEDSDSKNVIWSYDVAEVSQSPIYDTVDETLTAEQYHKIRDWSALSFRVTARSENPADTNTRQLKVDYARISPPFPGMIQVSFAEELIYLNATSYDGTTEHLYLGSEGELYVVNTDSLVNGSHSEVSKTTGVYASSGASVQSHWDFCSFGANQVVATNFYDPVQVRANNTGNFADLITAPSPAPKARFCAAVRNYLVLGNINLTGYGPDEIWWSKVEDIADFDTGDSSNQPLYSTAGEVTGLAGGDYGLAFKPKALHAMIYVGGSLVFRIEEISDSVGTFFPGSIVQGSGATYWFSGESFYKLASLDEGPVRIGSNVGIERFLLNALSSDETIWPGSGARYQFAYLQMTGAYDHASGIIFWLYRHIDDVATYNNRALLYNTREDRWALLKDDTASTGLLSSIIFNRYLNTGNDPAFLGTLGLGKRVGAGNAHWTRFDGTWTYEGTLTTKARQLTEDAYSTIKYVRPVFGTSPGTYYPSVTVTVSGASDQLMTQNVQTETVPASYSGEDRQYPLGAIGVSGNWFTISVVLPSHSHELIDSFLGVYLHMVPGSDPT